MTYAIHLNHHWRNAAPDVNGAESVTIEAIRKPYFEGSKAGALAVLKGIAIGASVTLRHPKGLRSCMNKPALWAALIEEY